MILFVIYIDFIYFCIKIEKNYASIFELLQIKRRNVQFV